MSEIYADHNVARNVADYLSNLGHTVTITERLGLSRAPDDLQLLLAAQRGWILLTHNKRDFSLLHDAWRRWSGAWDVAPQHAGIIVPPQHWPHLPIAAEVHALLSSSRPLLNELYAWQSQIGWVRQLETTTES